MITGRSGTVLLLGNYRPTITLARKLSGEGYRVISGLEGCDGGAEHSRFVAMTWDHTELEDDPDRFASELTEFVEANDVSVIFPVSEEFVRFFTERPELVSQSVIIAMVDPRLVEKCLDKLHMMELATSHQVPTAPFAMAGNSRQLASIADEIGFPIVIRPEESTNRLNGKKALIAEDENDLARQVPVWPDGQDGLIVQRKVSGRRHNIYFAAHNGQLFRYLHAVILRTDNPDGSGLAVDGITIQPLPELRDYTKHLAEALNYTGIGCAQYLVDDATGDVSFLEINARIAGNHAVPEYAGMNLSTLLIDLAAGDKPDTTLVEGKHGVRYAWTSGDIDAAKIAWLRSEVSHSAAASWVLKALVSAVRANVHMTFAWNDPLPGLMALKKLLPSMNRLVPNILGRWRQRSNAGTRQN